MAKKKDQYDKELEQIANTCMAAIRALSHKKAHQYERDFLSKVKDALEKEISVHDFVEEHSADMIGNQVKKELYNEANTDY